MFYNTEALKPDLLDDDPEGCKEVCNDVKCVRLI